MLAVQKANKDIAIAIKSWPTRRVNPNQLFAVLTPRKSRYLRQRVTGLLCIPDQGAVAELVGAAGEDLNAATESWNYGSILLTFRDMTTGRTTDDGLQGDRCRQPTHIWPLRRASYNTGCLQLWKTWKTWKSQGIYYFWKTQGKLREFEKYSGKFFISHAIFFVMQSETHNKTSR